MTQVQKAIEKGSQKPACTLSHPDFKGHFKHADERRLNHLALVCNLLVLVLLEANLQCDKPGKIKFSQPNFELCLL
ncbi:hypothetical protein D910_06029 [Dendroctonus ponderosae]|uniref:Uncharacterized protein n=1 Tax=Dendroctonus ponderosae TaxID=77166 RepID=U4TU34_DENPD|nr:hypothetical protein D910_00368 [Dendroctonus ponderosae]ERL84292.1 hypothetical protein D910_01697 [Dendroctonus ponderosae]ERL88645.1 hypothetical protein D910_06029 [Dendroctonus ponderosae]